jgi:2'-5' RNA ligase
MRLFVGIGLSSEAAQALFRVRERFLPLATGLRWSDRKNWHVTLQFLGSATTEQTACVTEKLAAVHAPPVPLRITGLGFFERAGIFWAGVELMPDLLALQQKVTAATRSCGFVPEDRTFHPHITLARAKGQTGARALRPLKAAVQNARADLDAEFVAEEFVLFESLPGPDGSRYEERGRFRLE